MGLIEKFRQDSSNSFCASEYTGRAMAFAAFPRTIGNQAWPRNNLTNRSGELKKTINLKDLSMKETRAGRV